ncbi:acyltransferase [Cellulophaga baltica]|uniref:acyltransferase n=1 Tax=Cellulophaga TaxID=104264 RepID=UPI001C07A4CA|nr:MULTISPECIES: acyltransferase [Cellulophaga]MBU2995970.1 acyltransferase [Cellulophaga baltica]MDO6767365.1 acyltransferase [Cellulophaga sp. 1_MG-2023]
MKKLIITLFRKIRTFIFTFIAKLSNNDFKAQIKANGFTYLTNKTKTGKNLHFNGLHVYGKGNVLIGDNFHSGKGCKIITDIHDYNGKKLPYDETIISKNVIIEDNVWLGMDVTLLGGVKIGEGAIIQAGSVVVSDIEALAIAGGHPAKVFSKRNSDHYDDLINKKSFF